MDECAARCLQVLAINPVHAKAMFRKGAALLAMNNVEEGEEALTKALELSPDDKAIQNELKKIAILKKKLAKKEAAMAKKMFG